MVFNIDKKGSRDTGEITAKNEFIIYKNFRLMIQLLF